MELSDPHHNESGHVHEAAPVAREQQGEDAEPSNTVKPAKPPNPTDDEVTKRLPVGTCKVRA